MGKKVEKAAPALVEAKEVETQKNTKQVITPKETEEYQITETHVRMLEEKISKEPDNWLWSHRRWKYKKEE